MTQECLSQGPRSHFFKMQSRKMVPHLLVSVEGWEPYFGGFLITCQKDEFIFPLAKAN